jgi:hypothetical protein
MDDALIAASQGLFEYPVAGCTRRHGPCGYSDYRAYKPWLRDDFAFRCVYCLVRERWYPSGHDDFAVDHVVSQAAVPALMTDYDNLVYACGSCNRNRQDSELPFHPAIEPLGRHLRAASDGAVEPLSAEGRRLLKICHLNRAMLVDFRRRMISLVSSLARQENPHSTAILADIFGFPSDLPNLKPKRPPAGNKRPEGIEVCYFQLRARGELPQAY